jgi:hypothetical protein
VAFFSRLGGIPREIPVDFLVGSGRPARPRRRSTRVVHWWRVGFRFGFADAGFR